MVITKPHFFSFPPQNTQWKREGKKRKKKGLGGFHLSAVSLETLIFLKPTAGCSMVPSLHSLKLRASTSLLLYIYTQSQKCTLITGAEGEEEAQTTC